MIISGIILALTLLVFANLIVIETAKREGVNISYREYLRAGFPLTIILTLVGLIYFAFV